MDYPARIHIGTGTVLCSVKFLAYAFGVSLDDVRGLLGLLELPVVNLPGNPEQYVNQYALELLLFSMGLPNVMRGDADLCKNLLDHAGTIYGSAKREIIRDRLRTMGLGLGRVGGRGKDREKNSEARSESQKKRRIQEKKNASNDREDMS